MINFKGSMMSVKHFITVVALAVISAVIPLTVVAEHVHDTQSKSAKSGHDMNKMWAEMRTRSVGMAVSVASDEKGGLWLARMQDGHIRVSHSEDGGKHFSEGVTVNPQPEAILAENQNRPKIAVRNGVIAVTWVQALPKVFAGNIRFARSVDGGRTFSEPVTVNDDHGEISHGFSALTLGDDGRVTLAWFDGRERDAAGKTGQKYVGTTVYYAVSEDGGANFSANRKLADHACECCRIGMTLDSDGVPVVFWRHVFEGSIRDFALARLDSQPKVLRASEDNWEINACPHHGGDIAVDEAGSHHLVWFTGNPQNPGLFYRRADGENMTAPHAFGDLDFQPGNPAVFAHGKKVYLVWREFDGNNYQLMASVSADRGDTWSPARAMATTGGAADLPVFVVGAHKPLIVWNSAKDGVRFFDAEGDL